MTSALIERRYRWPIRLLHTFSRPGLHSSAPTGLRRSTRCYGRFLESEDEAAGFGGVVEVETQSAFVHEVVSDGLGAGCGEGFPIGQAIVHLGHAVALEERAARVFGRAHTPVAKPAAQSPNVSFDLGNDFFAIAGHGCNPLVLSWSSLVTRHCLHDSSLLRMDRVD